MTLRRLAYAEPDSLPDMCADAANVAPPAPRSDGTATPVPDEVLRDEVLRLPDEAVGLGAALHYHLD
ncbi:MAG: hypothetical protein ACRDP1_12040 [Nocardioidaceae bacterium]